MRTSLGARLATGLQRRLPRRTVRFRLTLLYGGLFLLAGIAVLALTYVLVTHATTPQAIVKNVHGTERVTTIQGTSGVVPGMVPDQVRQLREQAERQHASDLHQLLVQSGIALGAATLLAFAAGWLMAGRVLRPLRSMTATAQRISQHNLHERLALTGPDDEIKDLADTIDGLLTRLQTAFDAQRRFVANVSHELRTPLTWERTLTEVSLADPGATAGTLRGTLEELLTSGQDQERLIEALLTLATSERGLDQRNPLDLAALTREVLHQRRGPAEAGGPRLHTGLAEAWTTGNADLLKRLIANLIDNAHRYNHAGGHVHVSTMAQPGRAVFAVRNSGPVVAATEISRLLQPFQRLTGERTTHPGGHGLGLSIATAIATAHDARFAVAPRPGGGLAIAVTFGGVRTSPVPS
ncbi:MAG TPA: HAMP domain-containing sensor histidine kinase [Streptosporangiaceae bacterium]|jgi:signal transduction histidine kinase